MSEIIQYEKTYEEYKKELDGELQRTAEGFVRIGYLLKVARDTNVLAESGYKSVAEFAEEEYNLNKTQVSRFISINDKFSEGGYSDHLLPNYQGYGYAKLTIMLQLPDAINEELTPSYSKAEIQALKDEIDEERKVTDIERVLEGKEEEQVLLQTIRQLGEDDPKLYIEISESKEITEEVLKELMAPAGDKIYSVRVKGIGRMMLSISEVTNRIKLINSRSGEKESYTWDELAAVWMNVGIHRAESGIECWEQTYERKCPVAPVQQEKPTPKKETKVVKAPKKEVKVEKEPMQLHDVCEEIPKPSKMEAEEQIEETEDEEDYNLPGQISVEDIPGVVPERITDVEVLEPEQSEIETLVAKVENLKRRIRAREWKLLLIDIKEITEEINRMN